MAINYATVEQLFAHGLPEAAFEGVPRAAIEAQLEASSRFIDTGLIRWTPPLRRWGLDIIQAVCVHAAWELMNVRGLANPAYADPAFRVRYEDWIVGRPGQTSWLDKVARGLRHPTGVVDSTPQINEASADGWSDPDRGWGRGLL